MKLVAWISLVVAMLVATFPSVAQESTAPAAVVIADTDGDGITDDVDACPTDVGKANATPQKNGCTARGLARSWVLAFLTKNAPPGRKTYFKFAVETKAEGLARYGEIADTLIDTAYDPKVKPLFGGPTGRARTIAVMLGVMLWETGFRRDVDFGLGPDGRGDKGRSWCLMQLHIGTGRTQDWNTRANRAALPTDPPDEVQQGYSGPELVSNRKACLSEGLRAIRGSFNSCKKLPLEYRLSAYASGSCDKGQQRSKERVTTGIMWYANSRALRHFNDAEVLAELQPTSAPKDGEPPPEEPRNESTVVARNLPNQ